MINFVLMHTNLHQVEDIVRLAVRLGVDQVNFKQCDVIRGEQGKGLGLFRREKSKEVREVEKRLGKGPESREEAQGQHHVFSLYSHRTTCMRTGPARLHVHPV